MPGPADSTNAGSDEVDPKRRKLNQYCYAHQDDDVEIVFRCTNGHGLCLECLRNFCSSGLPQTCVAENCKMHLDSLEIIKSFPYEERHIYEDKMTDGLACAAAKKENGEQTRRCQKCSYMEVADAFSIGEAFQCKNIHCAHYVEPSPLDFGLALLESAIIPVRCPRCSKPTVLDWGCTQMACETVGCNAKFCYCCNELFADDFDVHEGYYEEHYDNNPQCVKMTEEWFERDPSWPENKDEALEKFHAWAIRRNLLEVLGKNQEALVLAMESDQGKVFLRDVGLTCEEVLELEIEPLPAGPPPSEPEEEPLEYENFDTEIFKELLKTDDLEGLRDLFNTHPLVQPDALLYRALDLFGDNVGGFEWQHKRGQRTTISTEVLQFLIDFVDVDVLEYGGGPGGRGPALDLSIKNGFPRNAVEFLLGFEDDDFPLYSRSGRPFLHIAVENAMDDVVELLLERSADIDERNHEGHSAIFLAVKACYREEQFIKISNRDGERHRRGRHTDQDIASQRKILNDWLARKTRIVDMLRSRGADILSVANDDKNMFEVVLQKRPQRVRIPLQAETAHESFVRRIAEMFMKCEHYVKDVFQYFIRQGDDSKTREYIVKNPPQEPEKLLSTALAGFWRFPEQHAELGCVGKRRYRISEGMLQHLAHFGTDIPNSECLVNAVAANMSINHVLKFLVDKKANVGLQETDDKAPLWFAVSNLQPDVIQFLISNGANAKVIHTDGGSSLYHIALATVRGSGCCTVEDKARLLLCIALLRKAGTDINIKNERCRTPLDLAIMRELGSVVENCLIDNGAEKTWRYKVKMFGKFFEDADVYENHPDLESTCEKLVESRDVVKPPEPDYDDEGNAIPQPRPPFPGEDVERSQLLYGFLQRSNSSFFRPHDISDYDEKKKLPYMVADYLIQQLGADVNYYHEPYCESVLIFAIKHCDTDFVKHLVRLGANVQPDATQFQPLTMAAKVARLDIVQFLISQGASASLYNKHWQNATPMLAVVKKGHYQEAPIDRICDRSPSQAQTSYRQKCEKIGQAILEERMKIVDCLLEADAKLEGVDISRLTPLGWAYKECRPEEFIRFLASKYENLDVLIDGEQSLLHFLTDSEQQHLDDEARIRLINFVLDRGANVNVVDCANCRKWTPLVLASYDGCAELVELYLTRDANAQFVDEDGQTCIHQAVRGYFYHHEHFDDAKKVILALIAAGADVNKPDSNWRSALDLSMGIGGTDMFTFLKNECGAVSTEPVSPA